MKKEEFEKYKKALEQMFESVMQNNLSPFVDTKVIIGYYGLAISGLRERINKKQISDIQLEAVKKMWLEKEKTISSIVGEVPMKDIRDSISLSLTILKTDILIKGGCSCETCGLKENICPGKRV